jgi:hypothetical protein
VTSWTPQQIVDAMHEADGELKVLAKQFAWFKGQKEYWDAQYDLALAKAKVKHNREVGKYGADAAAAVAVSEQTIQIPWLPTGNEITLPDMVRLTAASFDLVSKEYNRLETHIMILQSVNKNVLQDYARANQMEYS